MKQTPIIDVFFGMALGFALFAMIGLMIKIFGG